MINMVSTICIYKQYAIIAGKAQGKTKQLERNYKQLSEPPLLSRLSIKMKVRQTPSTERTYIYRMAGGRERRGKDWLTTLMNLRKH